VDVLNKLCEVVPVFRRRPDDRERFHFFWQNWIGIDGERSVGEVRFAPPANGLQKSARNDRAGDRLRPSHPGSIDSKTSTNVWIGGFTARIVIAATEGMTTNLSTNKLNERCE
jgi:hypothetical protein